MSQQQTTTNYTMDKLGNWPSSKLRGHGWVVLSAKLCDTVYSFHLKSPGKGRRVKVEACLDIGAMMVVCGLRQVEDKGFLTSALLLLATDIKNVEGSLARGPSLSGLAVMIYTARRCCPSS